MTPAARSTGDVVGGRSDNDEEPRRVPALLKVDGGIGQTLIPGTDYRIAEIRSHFAPSGVEGELGHETTIIRFDPVASPPSPAAGGLRLDEERLAWAGRAAHKAHAYVDPASPLHHLLPFESCPNEDCGAVRAALASGASSSSQGAATTTAGLREAAANLCDAANDVISKGANDYTLGRLDAASDRCGAILDRLTPVAGSAVVAAASDDET